MSAKRRDFPSHWRPFWHLTRVEAEALLAQSVVENPRNGVRVTLLRVVGNGGFMTMDQREERVNVVLDDEGRIVDVDGCY